MRGKEIIVNHAKLHKQLYRKIPLIFRIAYIVYHILSFVSRDLPIAYTLNLSRVEPCFLEIEKGEVKFMLNKNNDFRQY